jgi:hypothetical protein
VPYSTYQLVASPPASTFPSTTAVVAPTDVAAPVTAVGPFAAADDTTTRERSATAAATRLDLMRASLPRSR